MAKSNQKQFKWSLESFEVITKLGHGSFGNVYLVRDKEEAPTTDSKLFALKVLDKKQTHQHGMELWVRQEIEIQSHLRHPHIVRCYDYFHDAQNVYLVLEYVERTLRDALRQQPYKRFDEKNTADIIWSVADALDYMHEKDVLHRDIKSDNLLLSIDGTLKLSDFGLAVHSPNERRRTMCGSKSYMAPESIFFFFIPFDLIMLLFTFIYSIDISFPVIRNESYTKEVDLWSLGILCHELLTGKMPEVQKTVKISATVSHQAKTFISALLQIDPKRRLTASAVKQHRWIVSKISFEK